MIRGVGPPPPLVQLESQPAARSVFTHSENSYCVAIYSGVSPVSRGLFTSAPPWVSSRTQPALPSSAATYSAVDPFFLVAFRSTPLARSCCRQSWKPCWAVTISGVVPVSRAWFGLAPESRSNRTQFVRPSCADTYSADAPAAIVALTFPPASISSCRHCMLPLRALQISAVCCLLGSVSSMWVLGSWSHRCNAPMSSSSSFFKRDSPSRPVNNLPLTADAARLMMRR
jgi:hypothetical protein